MPKAGKVGETSGLQNKTPKTSVVLKKLKLRIVYIQIVRVNTTYWFKNLKKRVKLKF